MKKITVVTPTYNRANKLTVAFESLKNQTVQDFEWLIIDDGSTDNTYEIVEEFKSQKLFPIIYKKQTNQGKHIALNMAFKIVQTELLMILDSDDCLTKTAIEDMLKLHEKYKKYSNIVAFVYQRGKMNNPKQKITQEFREEEFIDNYNSYIINKNIKGDKEEVFKTEIISKFQFPKFEGENFLGEGVLWSKISHNYDMVFCNRVIYLCEYLENGLTKSGRNLRMNNPNGGRYHAEEYLDKRYSNMIRIKNAILYLIYSKKLKKPFKETFKERKEKILLLLAKIPSEMIYYKWNKNL